MNKSLNKTLIFMAVVIIGMVCNSVIAVTSDIVRQSSAKEFLAGEKDNVVIDSQGTISLARLSETLFEESSTAWTVNCMVQDESGNIYLGTSPNAAIYRFDGENTTLVYKSEEIVSEEGEENTEPKTFLANEHIFAMGFDNDGKLLVGISGIESRLVRFNVINTEDLTETKEKMETVIEFDQANYIFSIVKGGDSVYVATGPLGRIYKLCADCSDAEIVYEGRDKNIISMLYADGFLYAGTDDRGVVLKIDTSTNDYSILFDSPQTDITGLAFDDNGDLFVTASKTVAGGKSRQEPPASNGAKGKPESVGKSDGKMLADGGVRLEIANSAQDVKAEMAAPASNEFKKGAPSNDPGQLYKITKEGFVLPLYSEKNIFLNIVKVGGKFFIGTGNDAELLEYNPQNQRQSMLYQDEKASQITSLLETTDGLYLGTANPAKLVKVSNKFAVNGTYTSDLIDAKQPAQWGKIQIDANIQKGNSVEFSVRSGNVEDKKDASFSEWSEPVKIESPVLLECPVGRFAQYRLSFSGNEFSTPKVNETAISYVVMNMPPVVELVAAAKNPDPQKTGELKIAYKAFDANNDTLVYAIDFKKIDYQSWIKIDDNIATPTFDWDTKTVEDGKYEIRVTASDEKSNNPQTALSGSWISEPIVIDNTAPQIRAAKVELVDKKVQISFNVEDELSIIGQIGYTIDSSKEWTNILPVDMVYDTLLEGFEILTEDLEVGAHVIAIELADDLGNKTYKSFEVNVK